MLKEMEEIIVLCLIDWLVLNVLLVVNCFEVMD